MSKFWLLILLALWMTACNQEEPQVIELPTRAVIPTFTPSATRTIEPSATPSSTVTPTPSSTVTLTSTPAPTFTPTPSYFSQVSTNIDRRRFMGIISNLQNFGTRHANAFLDDQFRGIEAARNYLRNTMTEYAANCAATVNLYDDSFSLRLFRRNTTQLNLVAEVRGIEPNPEVIIIGAHYDTVYGLDPERFMDDDEVVYDMPGADDNASGVAATLELMHLICQEPRQKTFVFVLFAAEEVIADNDELESARNGSRHFVSDFIPDRAWRVHGMINLDTIGSATDTRGAFLDDFANLYSAGPASCCSRQMARDIQSAAYVQLPEFRLNVADSIDRENRWGDHMSFTEAGYDAVRLFESSDQLPFRDTARDLINLIDPAYLETNIQVILAYVLGISEGVSPPSGIIVTGDTVVWTSVPGAVAYVVAQRVPNESNYLQFTRTSETQITLPSDTIFAIGSIGHNGLLGELSDENYIAPP